MLLAALDLVGGASILAVAVLGWRRYRTSAVLAAGAAAAWFAASAVPQLVLVHRPLLLHAVLALPGGRVRGLVPRVALAVAWLGVFLPLAALPWMWTLTGLLCAVEGARRRFGPSAGLRMERRASGEALLALAAALVLPVVERAVWPQSIYTVVPIATYLCAVALTSVLLLRGVLSRGRQDADAVIELSAYQTPARALTELATLADTTADSTRSQALRTAVGLLEDNVRLQAELTEAIDEVRASRARIIDAAVNERRRLEDVLADGVGRYLAEVETSLRSLRCGDEEAMRLRAACLEEVEQISDDVTNLARGLHPRVLVDRGLAAALVELTQRSPVRVDVQAPERRYPERTESTVWYACAEALANVWKHANATTAAVLVDEVHGALTARIRDDGVGGAYLAPDGGLTGLADRLADAGGWLSLASSPAGTDVTITVPLR